MSLSSKKLREAKGRQKTLPKLKTILADPHKSKCPELSGDELTALEQMISTAISNSGQNPQTFVTTRHIRLGLESSMRAINNRQCSLVLVSLSIKPRYLIGLLARNAEIKDETMPLYVQPQLENITQRLFGIQALTFALPTIDEMRRVALSKELIQWVEARKKPAKMKIIKILKPIMKIKKVHNLEKKSVEELGVATVALENDVVKDVKTWNGDYISFSGGTGEPSIVLDTEEDAQNLEAALSNVIQKASNNMQLKVEDRANVDTVDSNNIIMEIVDNVNNDETHSEADDFLNLIEYEPLTVHKIRPNPQKKPKKKRNKNKQKKN